MPWALVSKWFSKGLQLIEPEGDEAVRQKRIFESGIVELNNIGFVRLIEEAGEEIQLKLFSVN